MGDTVEKLKITEGLGQESNPGATRVRLIMAFLKRSFSVPPAFQFSSLCEYFPCFHSFPSHSPPWEKAEAQGVFWSTGYQHLYILLSKSFACFHLLMAMVKCKAGMGFPPGRGRAGQAGPPCGPQRPHTAWLLQLWWWKPYWAREKGGQIQPNKSGLLGKQPCLSDAGFCSLLIGHQLPAPSRVRDALK